jgi:predicted dehydrogenase
MSGHPGSLRVGVIGLGRQAQEDHLPALLESSSAALVGVSDIDPIVADRVASEYGVPAFRSHGELFRDVTPDFVIVAAPHAAHKDIVVAACRSGIHVLKEKPFAMSLSDAILLRDVADKFGVHVMTTLQRRFNPTYTSYFQLVEQIGDLFAVDVQYSTFIEEPFLGWRGQKSQAGGGCLIDMGYHMIDLIIWYLDTPDEVAATLSASAVTAVEYDAEDTAHLLLRWPSGLHGTVRISRFMPPKTEKFRVTGSKGIVEIERGCIRRLRSDGTLLEELKRTAAWGPAAVSQIEYFCRVISGLEPNMGDPRYHLQHAAFVDAAYASSRSGKFENPHDRLLGLK